MTTDAMPGNDPTLDDTPAAVTAGGLVIRPTLTGHEVMLVRRVRYADWSFPKGKLEQDESAEAAALREVHEETGLHCELGAYLGSVIYHDERIRPKQTHYWVMAVIGEDPFIPNEEIEQRSWFAIPDAAEALTRQLDRDLLTRI